MSFRKNTLPKVLIMSSLFVVALGYQNCAPANFVEQPISQEVTPSEIDIVQPPVVKIKNMVFQQGLPVQVTTVKTPVDIIWSIDNSGSMSEEVKLVKENFAAFVAGLDGKDVDFRLALISEHEKTSTKFGLSLPTDRNFLHVEQRVESFDPLIWVGKSICLQNQECKGLPAYLNLGAITTKGTGTLSNFLRPQSKKILVAVTDDDSKFFSASQFSSVFSQFYPLSQLTAFAFAGLEGVSTCGVSAPGKAYVDLARLTGGQVYDICQKSWSSTFASLVDSIQKISRGFDISLPGSETIVKIDSVELNGKPITGTYYSLEGRKVVISERAVEGLNGSVQVLVRFQIMVSEH